MQTKDHTLKLDSNGLTLDGNAVGGGGKQLYQHNLTIKSIDSNGRCVYITLDIINNSNTQIDYNALKSYLNDNGFVYQKLKGCSGAYGDSNNNWAITGIYYSSGSICISYITTGSVEFNSISLSATPSVFIDNVVAL